jgi:hypothetical protein
VLLRVLGEHRARARAVTERVRHSDGPCGREEERDREGGRRQGESARGKLERKKDARLIESHKDTASTHMAGPEVRRDR